MTKNKYGIIYYKDTANLGDDIQTYAAYRFLPKVDYTIDRENISYFVPDTEERVKVIMNGWYNHDKTKFLVTPYIAPLYISMHFSSNDLYLKPGYTFVDGYSKELMSKYNIGCRDKNTLKVLNKLGYKKAYFSSCLTTTIDPIGKKKTEDYIVVVDMNPKIVEHLREITDCKIIETTHWLFLKDNMTYEEKIEAINNYDKLSSEKRKFKVRKHANLSFEDRMKLVERQLELYQNAKMVITDRIHVGLPCLGLKTNVLLIYYDYNKDRVETFKEFLTYCSEEEFLKFTKEKLYKVKNTNKYLKYRKQLIKTVTDFINNQKVDNKNLPNIDKFININLKREDYIRNLYDEKINDLNKKNESLLLENKKLKNELEKYNKIKYSRSWKIIGKMYDKKIENNRHSQFD